MKTFKNYFLILVSALVLATGCGPEEVTVQPSVKLEASEKGADWLEFKITPKDAKDAAWVCVKGTETVPSADEILSTGTQADAAKASTAKAEGLEAETEYAIIAAVRNGELTAVSEVLKMTTSANGSRTEIEYAFDGAKAENTDEAAEGKYTVAFMKDGNVAMTATFTAEAGDRLPAGTYDMAGSSISASIVIDGENVTPASGSVTVELDGDDYSMTMQFVIDDQRAFKGTFEGKIEGYPVSNVDVEFEAPYIIGEYYGEEAEGLGNYYFFLTTDPKAETEGDGVTHADNTYYQIDIYSDVLNTTDETVKLPEGTYTVGSRTPAHGEINTVYSGFFETGADGGRIATEAFASGNLTITNEGSEQVLDLLVTTENGTVRHVTYKGSVALKNSTLPEKPEDIDIAFTDAMEDNDLQGASEGLYSVLFSIDGNYYEEPMAKLFFNATPGNYLPDGTYTYGDNLDSDSFVTVPDEEGYLEDIEIASGSAVVEIKNKQFGVYSVTMDFVLDDGRNFTATYTGSIENMPTEDKPEDVVVTFANAIEDNGLAEAEYGCYSVQFHNGGSWEEPMAKLYFDAGTPGEYLPAGTYTSGDNLGYSFVSLPDEEEGMIDVDVASGSAIVEIIDNEYSISMNFVLDDGRNFTATYTGAIDNMPIVGGGEEPGVEAVCYVHKDERSGKGDYTFHFTALEDGTTFKVNIMNNRIEGLYVGQTYTTENKGIDPAFSVLLSNSTKLSSGSITVDYNQATSEWSFIIDLTFKDGYHIAGATQPFTCTRTEIVPLYQ